MIGRHQPERPVLRKRRDGILNMAAKPKTPKPDEEPKRLNRLVGAGEAINRVLDPAFRKRGFASRDIITHWAAIAPSPYDRVAAPDRLHWPRGEKGADGAVLYLRCADSHKHALTHEGAAIAAAVNRYFGYFLVSAVRLAVEPFTPARPAEPEKPAPLAPAAASQLDSTVGDVEDPGLRDALRRLGRGIMGKTKK
jgi:hypothetical protein